MKLPRRLTTSLVAVLLAALLLGCASTPKRPQMPKSETTECEAASRLPSELERLPVLDQVSTLVELRCYKEAIALGSWARTNFREKTYSVSAEVVSVFVPEDSLSEYVLESYERAYLSFLLASAYYGLNKKDDSAVELRRSYAEGKAWLYNYGEDPVNALLVAALWDNLGEPDSARPFWKKLGELSPNDGPIRKLAERRIAAIEKSEPLPKPWRIVALGRLPELDWEIRLARNESGYYEVRPKGEVAYSCRSDTGARLPTHSWVRKIQERYASDYHPLLHAKSWVRLPIGVGYGLISVAAGVGVAVGGCGLDFYATGDSTQLCKFAIESGASLIGKSADITNFALKPDLRHWKRVPGAILITSKDDIHEEACFDEIPTAFRAVTFELGVQSQEAPRTEKETKEEILEAFLK